MGDSIVLEADIRAGSHDVRKFRKDDDTAGAFFDVCGPSGSVIIGAHYPLGKWNMNRIKVLQCLQQYLLSAAVCICSGALTGCLESSFTLAAESKLPRSMTLPPGLTRTDVSVTLNLYAPPMRGPDAKFVLIDRKGQKLAEVKGKMKELTPSTYCINTENGVTEIVKLKPYREHENMEQNGGAVALFYVIDDPAVVKEPLDGLQKN